MSLDPSHFIQRAAFFKQQAMNCTDNDDGCQLDLSCNCDDITIKTCLKRYYDKESTHWYSLESATEKFCQNCCYLKSYPFNPYKYDRCRNQYYQLVKTYDACCNPQTSYQYLRPVITKKPGQSSYTVEYVVSCPNEI